MRSPAAPGWPRSRSSAASDVYKRQQAIRAARCPLIISGGGTIYSEASQELRDFASATGIPVADTQAGKGAINWDHPCAVGGVGATGSDSANALAAQADLIIGIGTRYSDFTTGSQTAFKNPDVTFVNVNVGAFDCLLYTSPSPRDVEESRMPSSA